MQTLYYKILEVGTETYKVEEDVSWKVGDHEPTIKRFIFTHSLDVLPRSRQLESEYQRSIKK